MSASISTEPYLSAVVNLAALNQNAAFKRHQPAEGVSDLVSHFWELSWALEGTHCQQVIPNPYVNLVLYEDGAYLEGTIQKLFTYQLSNTGRIPAGEWLPDQRAITASALMACISDNKDLYTVEAISAAFGLSVRSVQRLISEYTGVTPKWVIRVHRLQEVKMAMESGHRPNWAELAQIMGYSDQSHLIRDFKAFFGVSPEKMQNTK